MKCNLPRYLFDNDTNAGLCLLVDYIKDCIRAYREHLGWHRLWKPFPALKMAPATRSQASSSPQKPDSYFPHFPPSSRATAPVCSSSRTSPKSEASDATAASASGRGSTLAQPSLSLPDNYQKVYLRQIRQNFVSGQYAPQAQPMSSNNSQMSEQQPAPSTGQPVTPSMAPMKRPTAVELIRLISGPRVDIYIGSDKEHRSIPKDLLCSYSPFFDRCFNGSFREAHEQKLELPEEKIEDFDIFLEFILRGTIAVKPGLRGAEETISQCLDFLKFADKYQLGDVSEAIFKPLFDALWFYTAEIKLPRASRTDNLSAPWQTLGSDPPLVVFKRPNGLERKDIELVFTTCPERSSIRTLVVQALLSVAGGLSGLHKLQEYGDSIEGFAAEVMFVIGNDLRDTYVPAKEWLEGMRRK